MIRINLLPVEARKRRGVKRAIPPEAGLPPVPKEGGVSAVVIGILIICFGLVGFLGFMIYKQKVADEQLLQEKKKAVAEYEKKIKDIEQKYADLKKRMELTSNELEILRALDPPNRLLWSEKLNMLAELIPDGIYLTQIKLTETVSEVQTKESKQRYEEWVRKGKKGKAPKIVKKPIITQRLFLYGVARAETPEDRLRLISKFSEALKNFKWRTHKGEIHSFYEHFTGEIDTQEIVATRIEGIPVTRFTFILKTKPFSS